MFIRDLFILKFDRIIVKNKGLLVTLYDYNLNHIFFVIMNVLIFTKKSYRYISAIYSQNQYFLNNISKYLYQNN